MDLHFFDVGVKFPWGVLDSGKEIKIIDFYNNGYLTKYRLEVSDSRADIVLDKLFRAIEKSNVRETTGLNYGLTLLSPANEGGVLVTNLSLDIYDRLGCLGRDGSMLINLLSKASSEQSEFLKLHFKENKPQCFVVKHEKDTTSVCVVCDTGKNIYCEFTERPSGNDDANEGLHVTLTDIGHCDTTQDQFLATCERCVNRYVRKTFEGMFLRTSSKNLKKQIDASVYTGVPFGNLGLAGEMVFAVSLSTKDTKAELLSLTDYITPLHQPSSVTTEVLLEGIDPENGKITHVSFDISTRTMCVVVFYRYGCIHSHVNQRAPNTFKKEGFKGEPEYRALTFKLKDVRRMRLDGSNLLINEDGSIIFPELPMNRVARCSEAQPAVI